MSVPLPVQLPVEQLSGCPTVGDPKIAGAEVFTGAARVSATLTPIVVLGCVTSIGPLFSARY